MEMDFSLAIVGKHADSVQKQAKADFILLPYAPSPSLIALLSRFR
jgi:hypothetical protein